ncbi:hypothetical protein T8K17_11245 [Thalassobaculum sp. OXR-137]|uniref:hypothetical protein n=1 Tax=Thalassobaculum sp. OXR-137 TaxID=3100173 RepID=UPI002AC8AF28|nr:hypothetical protein [Thalassobaculum sp. OXR-137]WPZ36710.1 hypothetical protein T8K17_11245 [Thalassobaculum sp. OXR-137]
MPPIEEGAGSSPAEDIVTAPVEGQVDTDANPAGSSAADKTEPDAKSERAAGLDLTLKALEKAPKAETGGEAASTSKGEDGKAKADAEAKPGEKAEEAEDPDAKLPFHKHPRWQEVTKENATLKEEVSSMKADVEQFRAIEEFRQGHGLEVTEVSDGYKIMALIKNSPAQALPYLKGLVKDIEGITGHTLPEDLQAEVDAGGITEERARELSIARATTATMTTRQKEAHERQTTERRAALGEELAGAGQQWAEEARKSDPEYSRKEKLVVKEIRAILHGDPSRTPKTVADVRALSDEALKNVNAELSEIMPRRPTPPSPAGMSATAVTAAKSGPATPLDVTRRALGL